MIIQTTKESLGTMFPTFWYACSITFILLDAQRNSIQNLLMYVLQLYQKKQYDLKLFFIEIKGLIFVFNIHQIRTRDLRNWRSSRSQLYSPILIEWSWFTVWQWMHSIRYQKPWCGWILYISVTPLNLQFVNLEAKYINYNTILSLLPAFVHWYQLRWTQYFLKPLY
jgi:hypothetical protein